MRSYVAHVELDIPFDTAEDPYDYFSNHFGDLEDSLVEHMGTVEIMRDGRDDDERRI